MISRLIDLLVILPFVMFVYPLYIQKFVSDSYESERVVDKKVEIHASKNVLKMVDMMLTMEEKDEKFCLSTTIDLEDGALYEIGLVAELTQGHFAWVNNIGSCTFVLHDSHGHMDHYWTYQSQYDDVAMEEIADTFRGEHHISTSCRVNTDSDIGNQKDFGDYNANWEVLFSSTKRSNLDFTSPPDRLTVNGFF